MKKIIVLLSMVSLAGCSTINSTDIQTEINDIQSIARQICSVVPAASAIGAIIAAGSPALATASEIATAICAAIGPAPASAKLHSAKVGEVKMRNIWTPKPIVINGVTVSFL